jgi:hypothetical protein
MSERSLRQTLAESGEIIAWDWSRLPQQEAFLTAQEKYKLISGGFGSGKTSILVAHVLALLMFVPGNLGYLGRMDGKALRASTMQTLWEMLPRDAVAQKNDQQGFLQLIPEFGGSRLVYGDFKDIKDFKNIPLGFYAMDQAEEVPLAIWDYLVGRLRRKVPVLTETGVRQYWVLGPCGKEPRHYAWHGDAHCRLCGAALPAYDPRFGVLPDGGHTEYPIWDLLCYRTYGLAAANPEGPSHWLFRLFPGLTGPHGKSVGLPNHFAVEVTVYDGLHAGFVNRDYVKDLEARYADNTVMADRYLLGKWVEAEGLVYPEWKRDESIIPHDATTRYDGKPLFQDWDGVYEYIDHGFTAPTAVGWVVIQSCECGCGKQNYFIVDSYKEAKKAVSYHCQIIKMRRERLPFKLQITYLDSQAFSKNQSGQTGTKYENRLFSIADEFADHGLSCVPTQKDWNVGHNRICELLRADPTHVHPITGALGAPHLFVLSGCRDVIEEFESYKWKKVRDSYSVTDEPQDGNDDHMDGLNGFVASRPRESRQPQLVEEEPAWLKELDTALPTSHHMAL